MLALDITRDEVQSGEMTREHRDAAVAALRSDGLVVLNDVIDVAHLAELRKKMLADVDTILKLPKPPFNFIRGNIQQDPPPFHPYLFRDVLMNEMVIAVTLDLLGPGIHNGFYSGNTNLPDSGTQPVHVDTAHLWPNMEAAHPAHGVVINVPVVDMTVHNGSIELWPGSHLDTTVSVRQKGNQVPVERVDARRTFAPPLQPTVRCGGVLIRDMRLWHRGVPNHSDRARPMIAMIHWISWWKRASVRFPKGTESFFEHPILTTDAVFVEPPIDYLGYHVREREPEKQLFR